MSSQGLVTKSVCSAFPPVEFVQPCRYRVPWVGAVLKRETREYRGRRIGDLLTVVLLLDHNGKPMRRRVLQTLDESWTTLVASPDLSTVNVDWLRLP